MHPAPGSEPHPIAEIEPLEAFRSEPLAASKNPYCGELASPTRE